MEMEERVEIENDNKEDIDYDKLMPNNYFAGFIGAAIGGLVGLILTIILFYIGIVSSWVAVVAIVIGTALYKKFGAKENNMMLVIVGLTSLVSCLLGVTIIYAIASLGYAVEGGYESLGIVGSFLKTMNEVEGFQEEYIKNIGLNVLFSGLGIFFELSSLKKKNKIKKEM